MFGIAPVFLWLILAALLFAAELASTSITSIWFALGAVAAAVAAWVFPNALWLQLVAFAVVSALLLYFTRPLLTKKLLKKTPTNADMYIGKTAVVTEKITPTQPGRARIADLTWQAKAKEEIDEGQLCTVVRIEGVSLVVEKQNVNV